MRKKDLIHWLRKLSRFGFTLFFQQMPFDVRLEIGFGKAFPAFWTVHRLVRFGAVVFEHVRFQFLQRGAREFAIVAISLALASVLGYAMELEQKRRFCLERAIAATPFPVAVKVCAVISQGFDIFQKPLAQVASHGVASDGVARFTIIDLNMPRQTQFTSEFATARIASEIVNVETRS